MAGLQIAYLLASMERFALLWGAPIMIAALQLLFVFLLQRLRWRKTSVLIAVVLMAAWVGLAGMIEWECHYQSAVPGYFEDVGGERVWQDNDGAVRTWMLAAGIVFPTVLLSLLALIVPIATALRHGASGLRPRNITGQAPNVNR